MVFVTELCIMSWGPLPCCVLWVHCPLSHAHVTTLHLQITKEFAGWRANHFLVECAVRLYTSHFTLPVSFIPMFSIKLICTIVIVHYFKAATCTCHCVDREGFDLSHMRTGTLHRWRDETKPSNKRQPALQSFTAELPCGQWVTWWNRCGQGAYGENSGRA